jgi:hypothetical protein
MLGYAGHYLKGVVLAIIFVALLLHLAGSYLDDRRYEACMFLLMNHPA